MGTGFSRFLWPDYYPDGNTKSNFPPNYGFKEPRMKKVMRATDDELDSALIPMRLRTFCAHHLLQMKDCFRVNTWDRNLCFHEQEKYTNCLYHEHLDRYKDFEREKRLMRRKMRIKERQAQMRKKNELENA